MSETMTLPTLDDFHQLLEKFLSQGDRAFAEKCCHYWPTSARQMADDLTLRGYPISQGKCAYIRDAGTVNGRELKHRDVKAINFIIERIEAENALREIEQLEQQLATRKAALLAARRWR